MNILVTWAPDIASLLPTDTFNVYYKLVDPTNLNTWSLANTTPLPSTATSYTITGLVANSEYRVAVQKTCLGSPSTYVVESVVYIYDCPIISHYQGPVVNGYPTVFYSMSYPNSTSVDYTEVSIYDITNVDFNFISGCIPCTPTDKLFPVGRGIRVDRPCPTCATPVFQAGSFLCGVDYLNYMYESNTSSGVGYYGLGLALPNTLPPSCYVLPLGSQGTPGDPILLSYGRKYRFGIKSSSVITPNSPPYTFGPLQGPSISIDAGPECTYQTVGQPFFILNQIAPDGTRLSGVQNYNTVTGQVRQVLIDGTNQTAINGSINHYQFSYTIEDAFSNTFPLVTSNGNPITTPSISYTRHAPLLITILPAQLTAGMDIICKTLNPGASIVLSLTGANYAGMTVANFCTSIANQLTAAGYPSDYMTYGGQNFIRFGLPDPIFTGAQIEVVGPAPVFASYNNNVYGLLNTSINSVPLISNDDVTASVINGNTIGQYKILTDPTWQTIPGGSNITALANEIIEFTMFDTDISIYEVENMTTSTVYDLVNNLNDPDLPTFNTLNNITTFCIKCDAVNLNNGDVLEFRFTNPFVPSLPFTNSVTINF